MTHPAPEPFGRYELVDPIGAGGMAEVFRARLSAAEGVQKHLVIKRILKGLSHDPAFVEMFIDEARVAALLQHPNVVQVYDFGQVGEHWYMAMEWVDGLNLHRLMWHVANQRRRLPDEFALYVAHEAAKGLHYAHTAVDPTGVALGVVHRDVCPQNLLVSYRGEVKVADFGIAKSAAGTFTTQGNRLKGHTSYMSPEQTLGRPVDPRADIFALGVVLHELLTGRRLFKADSAELTLERIRSGEVPRLRDTRPDLSPAVETLVHTALALDPDDRFASARALRDALAAQLPSTPDQLREGFAAWLEEACADLIAAHRQRLAETSTGGASVTPEDPTVVAPLTPPPPVQPPAPEPASGTLVPTPAPTRRPAALALLALAALLSLGLWWASRGTQTVETVAAPASEPVVAEVDPIEVTEAPAAEVVVPVPAPVPAPVAVTPEPTPSRPAPVAPEPAPEVAPPAPTPEPAQVVEVTPKPEAAPPEAAPPEPTVDPDTPGTVTVRVVDGWGQLRVDGKRVRGTTPFESLSLPPGTHILQVETPSTGRVMSREITLNPGEHLELVFE
ncbi:MAG: serine/threonine protein kinase [Alphaproteobacteria bacterium]|nr:serine/threonine protein kinase [Alphaproteobacteria bacterium]